MKLMSYRCGGRDGFGAVVGDSVVELADEQTPTLREALAAGTDRLAERAEAARATRPLADVELALPIPQPDKILCVGLNYRSHAAEAGMEAPERPGFFVRFPGSLVADGQPVVAPSLSEQFDYEGELAVVIGRPVYRASREEARAAVAGYACFADNSVRDWQKHSRQVTAGKNFRRSGAFGPWLVTADEIADLPATEIVTRHNGDVVQKASLSDMIFPVEDLIVYVSKWIDLVPGDVIVTGTPAGVGAFQTPPRWLRAGDRLEVEVSGVGTLTNTVAGETR